MSIHRLAIAVAVGALVVAPTSAQRPAVPSPQDIFGFRPGDDYRLADYAMVQKYFRSLARASDRVVLERIGESSEGRPLWLAIISSADNLRRREAFRSISEQLAKARDLTDAEAAALAARGRAVLWVDGGLHATEVAHGQFTPEFAWWLATDEGEEARRIRDNVIVLLMPNMNPDGLDIVVNWYRSNVGTPFETAPVPELYHHYIGHDNNRDWYMFTQVETRAVAHQLYQVWFPQIVYNHHQSGPFPGRIWVPPFENPVNPNLDPLVVTSINQIGETMKRRFAREGKPGVSSGIVYDMWWNGSMRGAPDFHNMLGFLTETALYRYATPHCYTDDEIPDTFGPRAGNLPARRATTGYPEPWLGGCWHLRDPIDYMMTATRAVADLAARFRDEYLLDIYRAGRRQIVRGERAEGGPFAYVIDVEAQHDPGAAVELLRVFRTGGIAIRRADRAFRADGQDYRRGVYVIGPQAFRPFVVDLMEPKTYPDRRQYPGGPPDPPYDMTGYELSLQMGVRPARIRKPFAMPGPEVARIAPPAGGVQGARGETFALTRTRNGSVRAINALLAAGAKVFVAGRDGGTGVPDGTFLVRGVDRRRLDSIGVATGVWLRSLTAAPAAASVQAAPRIGLYESYVANMPGGWTRWLLERYGFSVTTLRDHDLRNADLGSFDVIIVPDQSTASIVHGHAAGTMPPEYVGGIGEAGVANLRRFVRRGGWLFAFDRSVDFAIATFDLPLRNVVAGLSPQEFFVPGSLIRVAFFPDPVTRGLPDAGIAFFARSQVLEPVGAGAETVRIVARFAGENTLASGWAHGADAYLAGRAAGVRVPYGDGQVVALGFSPHFRGQPHNTFKLLFNTLFAAAQSR